MRTDLLITACVAQGMCRVPPRRWGRSVAAALAGGFVASLALGFAGCAGKDLRHDLGSVAKIIEDARRNGARGCAPKELALAEVNLERTRDELDLGNYVPALEHSKLADKYARLAFEKSPPDRCANADFDGDGIPNRVDRCPKQPEDKDGYQDEDGCPDDDNDADGIPDRVDRCPDQPEDKDGFEDEDGCPDDDNDHDRIPDSSDRCPDDPEDYDGYKDEDGCPDEDNDGDRIPDARDKCPNQPEDYDGDEDDDGCPDIYKLVVVTPKKIELRQKVFFATGKARIRPRSYPLLREVAQVLRDQPRMYVRIEGHTDSRGSEAYNKRLSDGRASAVRTFMIGEGIAPDRLEAVGYGEEKPIADNRTRSGRAANRRVEFMIVSQ